MPLRLTYKVRTGSIGLLTYYSNLIHLSFVTAERVMALLSTDLSPDTPMEPSSTQIRSILRLTVFVTVLATLTYAVFFAVTGWETFASALPRLGEGVLVQALLLVLLGYGFRFLRWEYFARHLGHRIPVVRHLLYYVAGLAFTATPGKAGEVVKSVYMRRHGVTYAVSVGMLVAERALDVVVMGLMALLVMSWFQDYLPWLAGTLAILFAGLYVLVNGAGGRGMQFLLTRVSSGRLKHTLMQVSSSLGSAGLLLGRRCLGMGLGLGVLAWGSEAIAFWLLADAFGISLPIVLAAGIFSLSILVGALSFLPGGLGGTESAMGVMLVAVGADLATALTFILVFRVLTLWFAVFIGLCAMGVVGAQPNEGRLP